ncbi:GFA family protein [Acinetobacter sp. NIPH1876]|uniref:GFA family protein n=1 Tax=Acinetobacter TaxID=469 RepID=UPI001F4AB54B|nr:MULTISPECIES: GFA family protein [Acinetobacter]MCH7302967.1 GFA family protein [Acinetobacter higginsii]MCH7339746.1 GFA family protein [Acinetobacter higginsii]MCJ0828568.1 GFA family protein [Acinetobacter sp. NIPH1876]
MSQASPVYRGSCLCDGIHYEIHGEIGEIIQCHCQRCRKANGTAYATNAPISSAAFKITQGEELVKKFAASGVYRWFCGECGSPLISSRDAQPELYRLRIGTLDTPLQQKPSMHIFAASKAEWDCIADDLPQYAERP